MFAVKKRGAGVAKCPLGPRTREGRKSRDNVNLAGSSFKMYEIGLILSKAR